MSRTASTIDRTEQIVQKLKSSNCKAEMQVQWDNDGTWQTINDIDGKRGVAMSKKAIRHKYANFSLIPLASTINFNVLNKSGEYSEGSGTALENALIIDRKVKVNMGYILPTTLQDPVTTSLTLNEAGKGFYFYTQNSGGSVILDSVNSGASVDINFQDLFSIYYDAELYDSKNYTPTGYYKYIGFDTGGKGWKNIEEITVTANTTKGTIYYRTYNETAEATQRKKSTQWHNGGSTINGTQTVTVDKNDRYLDIAVVLETELWTDTASVTAMTVKTDDYIEWVFSDVYYLDTPQQIDPKDGFSLVQCKGRNIWKRAIETDVNLSDLSAGVSLDQLVKDIADIIGLPYTASSIADLSSFGNRTLSTGYGDSVKADKVYTDIMTIIQDDYQMYMEYDETTDDNVLFVQLKPTVNEANWVLNYQDYTSMKKKKDYGRLLKRITVVSNTEVVDAEILLDSDVTQTSTGAKQFTWSGEAIYKRVEFTTSDSGFTIEIDNVSNESLDYTITAGTGTGTWTAKVYGNKFDSTVPTAFGEAMNSANMINGDGITARLENKLVLSDAECETISEGFVSAFGNPTYQANVLWPYLNLILEINDQAMIWSKNLFTDDLYIINGYTIKWNNYADSIDFILEDSGRNFSDDGDFIYDRSLYNVTQIDIEYDKGFVYDMVYGVNGEPSDVVTSKYKHNVGEA
jgi:hypothetical protein